MDALLIDATVVEVSISLGRAPFARLAAVMIRGEGIGPRLLEVRDAKRMREHIAALAGLAGMKQRPPAWFAAQSAVAVRAAFGGGTLRYASVFGTFGGTEFELSRRSDDRAIASVIETILALIRRIIHPRGWRGSYH